MRVRSRKQRNFPRAGFSRRPFVQLGLGAAATGFLLKNQAAWAASEKHPTLGTFPPGVQNNNVFVGGVMPLTGPYSNSGEDMKDGFDVAVKHINEGRRVTEQIPSLKGRRGVLGKKIETGIADSEAKPNPAIQAATRFIRDNKAIMLTGSVSSAVSIALEQLGQREKVIFMVGNSGSNDTTGSDCQRYGFRSQRSAYMAAKALAGVLAKEIGKSKKVAYLTPDYTHGHSVVDAIKEFTGKGGWTVATNKVAPLGTTDFSSYLLNIVNSDADVFVNVAFGADAVASSSGSSPFS